MRGHSHGEWYGTVDNVAASEADAEYWAVFGVTHRGNRHCLGEFLSKDAALAAVSGFDRTSSQIRIYGGNAIVHIEAVRSDQGDSEFELFALFDDGAIRKRTKSASPIFGELEQRWQRINQDELPDDHLKDAFKRALSIKIDTK